MIDKICIKCGKIRGKRKSNHNHHITYQPEETIYLCARCHGDISSIDSIARQIYRKIFKERIIRNSDLDNSLRKLMFIHFLNWSKIYPSRPKRKSFVKEILYRFINLI